MHRCLWLQKAARWYSINGMLLAMAAEHDWRKLLKMAGEDSCSEKKLITTVVNNGWSDGCCWGLPLRRLPRKSFARASVLLFQTFWILVWGMLRSMEAKICRHVQIIRIIHGSSYYFGAKRFWDANPWVRPWILSFCPIRPTCNIATSNAL